MTTTTTDGVRFTNLTPHTITIVDGQGAVVATLPPSGLLARCRVDTTLTHVVGGIEVFESQVGELTGLPAPQEGVVYVTSLVAKQAAQAAGRRDVASPGQLVRGPDGQPVGCRGLMF